MSAPVSATTRHTHAVVFGRREAGCPRCAELSAGAPVRRWNQTWRSPAPRMRLEDWYCFCATTSLAADRCPRCHKRPYTD